jgi:uncharacterized protein YbcV (DUF1398 family)
MIASRCRFDNVLSVRFAGAAAHPSTACLIDNKLHHSYAQAMQTVDLPTVVRDALDRIATRPRAAGAGFPFFAATLHAAGVRAYSVDVPAHATLHDLGAGHVLVQGTPLRAVGGFHAVAPFDERRLVAALRANQEGMSTYGEFIEAAWLAGVVRYDVDLAARTCTYRGAAGEVYTERYPAVDA